MGRIIAGIGSSHAATLEDPSYWDDHRGRNRAGYERRYGTLPPEQPGVAAESPQDVRARHAWISDGLAFVRQRHVVGQVFGVALIAKGLEPLTK